MNTKLPLARTLVFLLLIVALALVLLSQEGEADPNESCVAIYMHEDEDNVGYVEASNDDFIYFNLSLEMYEGRNGRDRYVLLYIEEDALVGEKENWDLMFVNPIGGWDAVNYTYKDVDYHCYLVEYDQAEPTRVEIGIEHHYNQEKDNQDRIEYKVRAYEFEVVHFEKAENKTKFYEDLFEDRRHETNISYLLESRDYTPTVDYDNEIRLNARVISNPFDPQIYVTATFNAIPGETYTLEVNLVNEGEQEDELKLTYDLDTDTEPYWTVNPTNYEFGTKVKLGSGKGALIYIELTASEDRLKVPDGLYDFILDAVSEGDPGERDEATVEIVVPVRYDPLLQVVGEDDKNAAVDGSSTTYDLRLNNRGVLDETFDLFAEVQDRTVRAAGDTDDYWTKQFSLGPVWVEAGTFVDLTVNLTPTLDNEMIPPGKYPVVLEATSQKDSSKTSADSVVIRMPNLYDPEVSLDGVPKFVQVGTEGDFLFTVTNNGVVQDTMSLDSIIKVGDDHFTVWNPADWEFEFVDAGTDATINVPYQLTLGTTPDTMSKQVHLYITPPPGVPMDDYPLTIIVKSQGPIPDVVLDEWQGSPLLIPIILPDLYISSNDIIFDKAEVTEGDPVEITATVHLDGFVGSTVVKVYFYYHAYSQEFVSIGSEEMVFSAPDSTQTVTFTWEDAKIPYSDVDNIRVGVDHADAVLEENENNNAAEATLRVKERTITDPPPRMPWYVSLAATGICGALLLLIGLGFPRSSQGESKSPPVRPQLQYQPYRPPPGTIPGQQPYSYQPPPGAQQPPPGPVASIYNYQQSEPVQKPDSAGKGAETDLRGNDEPPS